MVVIGGGIVGGGRGGASMRPYVYIDGGYLRARLHYYSQKYCGGDKIDLSFEDFFNEFEKKFYYDCLPPKRRDEDEATFRGRLSAQCLKR